MDGIKRRQIERPRQIEIPRTKNLPTPSFQKREELFIPRDETVKKSAEKKSKTKKGIWRKTFWALILIIAIFSILYVIFFALKTRASFKKMNVSASNESSVMQDVKSMISPIIPSGSDHQLKGQELGRVNILLLGAAGEKKPGGNLTDTVMILSIDTKNKKVAMLSLPRDFYVPIPGSNINAKINSLYKIGINENKGADLIKEAVEKVTSIKINYFIAIDFEAFEKIIDNIGGVNIVSERDIYDPKYPGPNYSYETFSLTKGPHLLDGATALKYVRERHNDPEGDFGRAKRQQQVIQATKNKLFSMQTLFNVVGLNNILTTLSNNIKTDMGLEDIDQFIKLSKTVDTQNINNVVIDAWKPESLLKVSHVMLGNDRAFILVPRVGNYSEIQDVAQNVFDQSEIKKRRAMIEAESANVTIINQSGESQIGSKIKKLLSEKLGMKNAKTVSNESGEILSSTIIQTNSTGSGKIFTLDELIKKIPATLDPQKNESEDEIVIRLGSDLIETYKYDEDSIDDFNKAQDSQELIDFTKQNN